MRNCENYLPTPNSPETIEAALLMLNWKSLTHWARERGYNPRTVRHVVATWGGREKAPHGGKGAEILAKVKSDIESRAKPPAKTGRVGARPTHTSPEITR